MLFLCGLFFPININNSILFTPRIMFNLSRVGFLWALFQEVALRAKTS